MSTAEPTRHTYSVRCGVDLVARVEGTAVNVDSAGTLAVWDGSEPAGVYPAHTHSVTRLAPAPTVPGVDELVRALNDDGVAFLARRVRQSMQMEPSGVVVAEDALARVRRDEDTARSAARGQRSMDRR